MSREIKFRIWDKENQEMIVPNPPARQNMFIELDGAIGYAEFDGGYICRKLKQESYILMQYTGLKDKNGREIYEGDLVLMEYNHLGKIEVKFQNGQYNIVGYNLSKSKVIGDIFSNPVKEG